MPIEILRRELNVLLVVPRVSASFCKQALTDIPVDPREGTNFRLGHEEKKEVIRKGKSKDTAEMETDMALESEVVAEEAMEIPEVPPAMIEAQKRRADLERLNTIDEQTRMEIASMDVMGEFGSKVGLLLSVLERSILTYADQFLDQTSTLV